MSLELSDIIAGKEENFDNISNFFVIYDHLWAFCTTNYMKRYKITTNALE